MSHWFGFDYIGPPVKRGREEEDVIDIPSDVWVVLAKYLDINDLKALSGVNTNLLAILRSNRLASRFTWVINGRNVDDLLGRPFFRFIQRVKGVDSLQTLEKVVDNVDRLTHLEIPAYYQGDQVLFTETITHLNIQRNFGNFDILPKRLEHLIINNNDFNDELIDLPSRLKSLWIRSNVFNQPLNALPSRLEGLNIVSPVFNLPVDDLPDTLVVLEIRLAAFDLPIARLPPALGRIVLNGDFNQPIDAFPPSLTYVWFGAEFNQPIPPNFPNLKTCLFTSSAFMETNNPLRLPKGIEKVIIEGLHMNYY